MSLSKQHFFKYIKDFDLTTLFNEMGWDNDQGAPVSLAINEQSYKLTRVAQKRGFTIFLCNGDTVASLPDSQTRRKIFTETRKRHHENLIIFTDKKQTVQIWLLETKSPQKPLVRTEIEWNKHQEPELLFQKLAPLCFSLDEEENITLFDVKARFQDNFQQNNEKVTKKFYKEFQKHHDQFKTQITGIEDNTDLEWYTSVMLNRLMFIYFIQKKGFLDGNVHYLREKLQLVQQAKGQDKFQATFYRHFLLRLFHDGLGKRHQEWHHDAELKKWLGNVPYLNGGFFDVHEIENRHGQIDIPDAAFEKLFVFFDEWNWHLDTRQTASGRDINPDVVGYIFEQYINRKQMGAYYTKEDITEYISKNTILPFLLEKTKEKLPEYFEPNSPLWKLLADDPDRYIYESVRKGVDEPLPENIAAGMTDVSKRTDWNKAADEKFALPTETWREHVARRTRCLELRKKLTTHHSSLTTNDLITYNLDIRQFVTDALDHAEDIRFVESFFEALQKVTILDPTCGSGAFLFAAMNILEPLYEICINILPSRNRKIAQSKYAIYKHIILHNLYGVDIIEEAVEICKLRLFLKLAAEVENNKIEPLPDIDFNIRSGNTLVGYATVEQMTNSMGGMRSAAIDNLETMAKKLADAYKRFVDSQTDEFKEKVMPDIKVDYRQQLDTLNEKLNQYFASVEYGMTTESGKAKWKQSHRPFHWWIEFYGIMQQGGFDCIIGNPPYVEYSGVKKEYAVKGYETEKCGNLYALVVERCFTISPAKSRIAMIIQLPAFFTPRMEAFQNLWFANSIRSFLSFFDDRPGKLFDGLNHIRVAICINEVGKSEGIEVATTTFRRFYSETRDSLFENITFANRKKTTNLIIKSHCQHEKSIVEKIVRNKTLQNYYANNKTKIYYHNAPQYFIRAMTKPPYFWNEKEGEKQSDHVKSVSFSSGQNAAIAGAVLNSSLFYWWFIMFSNCRDFTRREIDNFPLSLDGMQKEFADELVILFTELNADYEKNKVRKECQYKTTGQVIYDEYFPKLSKPIIDRIDALLAEHYGFTEEELDFIINYDIKYRMGGAEE